MGATVWSPYASGGRSGQSNWCYFYLYIVGCIAAWQKRTFLHMAVGLYDPCGPFQISNSMLQSLSPNWQSHTAMGHCTAFEKIHQSPAPLSGGGRRELPLLPGSKARWQKASPLTELAKGRRSTDLCHWSSLPLEAEETGSKAGWWNGSVFPWGCCLRRLPHPTAWVGQLWL